MTVYICISKGRNKFCEISFYYPSSVSFNPVQAFSVFSFCYYFIDSERGSFSFGYKRMEWCLSVTILESLGASIIGGLQELAEKISDPSSGNFEPQINSTGQYVPVSLPADTTSPQPWEVEDKPIAKVKPAVRTVPNTRSRGLFFPHMAKSKLKINRTDRRNFTCLLDVSYRASDSGCGKTEKRTAEQQLVDEFVLNTDFLLATRTEINEFLKRCFSVLNSNIFKYIIFSNAYTHAYCSKNMQNVSFVEENPSCMQYHLHLEFKLLLNYYCFGLFVSKSLLYIYWIAADNLLLFFRCGKLNCERVVLNLNEKLDASEQSVAMVGNVLWTFASLISSSARLTEIMFLLSTNIMHVIWKSICSDFDNYFIRK